MRRVLGLAVSLTGILMALSAAAQGGNSFARCGAITDRDARLACYDSLQSGSVPAPSSHNPEFNAAPRAPAAPGDSARNPPPLKGDLNIAVASYALSRDGRFRIVLTNGQIWEQLDSDGARAHFRDRENRALITRGFWNSYDLRLNGSSAIFKVSRVR